MKVQRSAVLSIALLAGVASASRSYGQTAREIIDRVDRIMRGESSHGRATMEVKTEHWDRSLTMEVWSLGTEYSLVRIIAPPKEAGTATLKAEDDIWNYLPKVDRTIKIPASMMMGSWMGSHFTNDDLVKESRLVEDYEIEIGFEGERDGEDVWELVLTPKPDAPVVWGRVEYRVRRDDLMPLWARYYDEDGTLMRTLTFSEFEAMGGRLVPSVMQMQPEDKSNEHTTVRYESLEFGVGLDESFFSLQNLKQRR